VNFIYDLVIDWSSPHTVPDIYEFVPYTWHLNFQLKEFELLLAANEFNWIDTESPAGSSPENSKSHSPDYLNNMGGLLPSDRPDTSWPVRRDQQSHNAILDWLAD